MLELPFDLKVAQPNKPLGGTVNTRPNVPKGVVQRRVTYSKKGVLGPRHWLRTTADGGLIAFLSKDDSGYVQIYAISPQGGESTQLTKNHSSVQGSFHFSPDGRYIAYPADDDLFVTNILTGKTDRLTNLKLSNTRPIGAPVWSNQGDKIAYNRYVKSGNDEFLQIFVLHLKNHL